MEEFSVDEEVRVEGTRSDRCCSRLVDLRAGVIPVGLFGLLLLLLLLAVAAALCQAVLDDVFFDPEKKAYSVQTWLSWLMSFVPLFFAVLFLSVPPLRATFASWQKGGSDGRSWRHAVLPSLVPLCWFFSALPLLRYDPLAHAYVTVMTFAAIGAVHAGRSISGKTSNWIDLFVGVALFAMLDLRWVSQHFYIGENSYNFFAVAFSLIVISAWILADVPFAGFELSLIPHWRDCLFALGCLVAEAALIIPVGLLTGFLHFPPRWAGSASAGRVAATLVAGTLDNFATTALPEELFFRGLLYNGIRHHSGDSKKGKAVAVAISSCAFGLMHWVRTPDLLTRTLYVVFATYAGGLYCLCYILAGNSLFASILAHVLTDVIWSLLFT